MKKKRLYYGFDQAADAQSVQAMLGEEGIAAEKMTFLARDPDKFNLPEGAVKKPNGIFLDVFAGAMAVGALGGLFELIMETKVFHIMEFGPATIYPLLGMILGILAGLFLGALIGLYIYLGRPEAAVRKELVAGRLVLVAETELESEDKTAAIGSQYAVQPANI